jgi:hypothetical protein
VSVAAEENADADGDQRIVSAGLNGEMGNGRDRIQTRRLCPDP